MCGVHTAVGGQAENSAFPCDAVTVRNSEFAMHFCLPRFIGWRRGEAFRINIL
jgi:hypothetical protein